MSDNITHRPHSEAIWQEAWENRKLVYSVARSFNLRRPWVDTDEVFMAGLEGLCRALEKLDRSQPNKCQTRFLCNTIKSAIATEIKFLTQSIHVPHDARGDVPTMAVEWYENDLVAHYDDETDERSIRVAEIIHEAMATMTEKQRSAIEALYGLGETTRYPMGTTDAAHDAGVDVRVFDLRRKKGMNRIRRYLENSYPGEFACEISPRLTPILRRGCSNER